MVHLYKRIILIAALFIVNCSGAFAQLLDCAGKDTALIYILPGQYFSGWGTASGYYLHPDSIYVYNPVLPVVYEKNPARVAVKPMKTQTGTLPQGLAISTNINGGTPATTFYTIMRDPVMNEDVYYYYNGTKWVSTKHRPSPNPYLLNYPPPYVYPHGFNIAAGGGYIYNLATDTCVTCFSRNAIYRYDGKGDAVRIAGVEDFWGTRFTGFAPDIPGICDMQADCEGNVYVLRIDTPYNNRWMKKYGFDGKLLRTWTVTGIAPSAILGGLTISTGLAIIGDSIYISTYGPVFYGYIDCYNVHIIGYRGHAGLGADDFATCSSTLCRPAPNASFTKNRDSFCTGNTVVFNNTTAHAFHYEWDFGDGATDTVLQPVHAYTTAGTYFVRLIAYDAIRCQSDILYDTLYVFDPPATPQISVRDTQICAHGTIHLSVGVANLNGNMHFNWLPADAVIADADKQTALVNTNLANDFYVTVTDSILHTCGLSVTDKIHVSLFDYNSLQAYRDTTICAGDTISLYALGGDIYRWKPDVYNNNGYLIYIHPNQPTDYSVEIRDSRSTCHITRDIHVGIYYATADAGADQYIRKGATATLRATGGVSYQWKPNVSSNTQDSATVSVSPEVSTTYYATAITEQGCKATDSVMVRIIADPFIPSAFSPNGDGKNDVFTLITQHAHLIQLNVYNRWGQLVFTGAAKGGWDGSYKGEPCEIGNYFYTCSYVLGDKEYDLKGEVTLIR